MIEDIILRNTITGKSIGINKDAGPFFTESIIIDPVESRQQSYSYPGQDGKTVESVYFESREVTITGWAITDDVSSVGDYKGILNKFVNPKQPLEIHYKGYVLEFNPDSSVKYATSFKDNNDTVCKFQISGTAYNPLWVSESPISTPYSVIDHKLTFPFHMIQDEFVLGELQFSPQAVIRYNGQATGCVLSIQSLGEVVSPRVTHVESNTFFEIDKTLHQNESILIDTSIGKRKVIGTLLGVEQNYIQYMSVGSSWIELNEGDNTFVFTAQSGASLVSISVAVYPKNLEVEYD